MSTNFHAMTRAAILESFGYLVMDRGQYHVALIKADPEAFLVVCEDRDDAEIEAYAFLYNEVDPDMHDLPNPCMVAK